MTISQLVRDVEHGFEESQNQRDARVEELWISLEPEHNGELDLKGLQKGLRKIDHPMKNADDMLRQIMNEVDKNNDGKIQYEEFRKFVEKAERQLYLLFKSIDRDGDGKLDKAELQTAFRNAGLCVSNRRLAEFFDDIDINNDGFITFDEWRPIDGPRDHSPDCDFYELADHGSPRNFLLFMPAHDHDSQLHAVLSFYYSVVSVTPEGDSIVSEETLEGLGTDGFRSLFITLFGSLLRVAFPSESPKSSDSPSIPSAEDINRQVLNEPTSPTPMETNAIMADFYASDESADEALAHTLSQHAGAGTQDHIGTKVSKTEHKKYKLTDFVPDPGYFVAGAIAGGVSRTATAPLDRLKVYLLVNTSSGSETAGAALRQGSPLAAVRNAAKPLGDAVRDLFRNGGIRSFFAGNGLNVVKIMPETAIKFGSYEAAKRALANLEGHGDPKKINSYSKFTAGGIAGMIAQSFVYPLDTLKFRLQCETVKDGLKGAALVRQTAIKMYADGGVAACYRGLTMGLVGMFPYSAIDMGMFEFLKKSYKGYYAKQYNMHEDDVEPGNIATGIIGATSGAFGASVVYPLNVVRTRLQTQGTAMHRATYTGIWDVTQKTIQKEGYRGLYKGLTPNLLKVAPALSITWVVYENSKRALNLH
ncbi:mitochondrial carrier domain-containing protein [Mariannaea sp. PMI_226]|nr:mitochondrial carrier domain-containing protein [Mariannaea sp. PMI_226]